MSGDDGDVLARARSGDRSAFGALVRQYQRRVYATALHMMGNHHDADDVVQETFIRAFRGLGGFDGRADLYTWLYRITVNTALNHIRSRKRVHTIAAAGAAEVGDAGGRPEKPGDAEPTPREWMEIGERYRRVVAAIDGLSPTLRVTLILATVEGRSYRDIADLLDVPEGTVAWRVNEARKKLRERLDAESAPDGGAFEGTR